MGFINPRSWVRLPPLVQGKLQAKRIQFTMTTAPSGKFIFVGHQWSPEEDKATFTYQLQHKQETVTFTETLHFPQSAKTSEVPQELLQQILNNILLALGVSYYKLYCPKEL